MTQQTVRRRHVFFMSGFDPKGAAYYHRLYATGAAAQALVSEQTYEVGHRERTENSHVQQWSVVWRGGVAGLATTPTEPVHTTFEYLAWDDLVRAHWPRGGGAVAWGSLLAYWTALSSGLSLLRVWQQSRRTLIALAYPAVLWLLALTMGTVLSWLAAQLMARFGEASQWTSVQQWLGISVAAMVVFISCGWGALEVEKKLHTSWLLRIYRFADLWARDQLPDLDERLDMMAARIYACLQRQGANGHDPESTDEVLLVGFSVGSMLAVSVMARILSKCQKDLVTVERLSLLTLGQCVPLLGLMPRAQKFRGELQTLSLATGLCWVDYSSPPDWGSFALVDPLAICGVATRLSARLVPEMRSPRFHTLFDADDYAKLKKDKRRVHLQYLMASPKSGGYDYFSMTAGPWRLRQSLRQESNL